ncbi:hypothetical protein HED54_09875 [Ochrobactrum anthropi ATCC 49188]|nr:hypothetical protein [Brucella anthropi ATCC 49188]
MQRSVWEWGKNACWGPSIYQAGRNPHSGPAFLPIAPDVAVVLVLFWPIVSEILAVALEMGCMHISRIFNEEFFVQHGERMMRDALHCVHLAIEPIKLVFSRLDFNCDDFTTVDCHHINAVSTERGVNLVDDARAWSLLAQKATTASRISPSAEDR